MAANYWVGVLMGKIIFASVLIIAGMIVIGIIYLGQIDSSGLKGTLGVLAAWSIGSGLKVFVDGSKTK